MTKGESVGAAIGSAMFLGLACFDLSEPRGIAAGVTYVGAVAIALISESRRLLIAFGVTAIILCIAGGYLSTAGASPFTLWGNRAIAVYAILVFTIPGMVLLKRHEDYDARLRRMATTDALTDSNNRRAIIAALKRRMDEALRYHYPLSVLMLDIDDFKQVNDRFGHPAGDRVLQVISKTCQRCMRTSDHFGRYGGEEFLGVLPHTSLDDSLTLAERIGREVEELRWPEFDHDLRITVSIGGAALATDTATIENLIACADKAMFAAKKAGKNRLCAYEWTPQAQSKAAHDSERPTDALIPAGAPKGGLIASP